MDFYNNMFERREKLLEKVKKLQIQILQMPEGKLHVHKDRSGYKWMLYRENRKGEIEKTYLPKEQIDYARQLANSTLLQARLTDTTRQLKGTERFLRVFDPACRGITDMKLTEEEKLLANPGFVFLAEPFLSANFKQIEAWKKETYESNTTYHPEQLRYQASNGLFVRSKSETMIANEYIRARLPFRYEMRVGEDKGSMICDFVILHPQSLQVRYHEHLGKMDDPSYARSAAEKLEKYAALGIYPGVDLILTSESLQHPLTTDEILRTIRHYFG